MLISLNFTLHHGGIMKMLDELSPGLERRRASPPGEAPDSAGYPNQTLLGLVFPELFSL